MKKLISVCMIFFASTAMAEKAAQDVVDRGLCEYWGKDVDVPGNNPLSDLAEAGLTIVEVGAETVICGVEGTAYLFHRYGLKPIGAAGKALLCGIGEGITSFLEIFFGPATGADDNCSGSSDNWDNRGPGNER